MKDYKPIDCELYCRYELAIVRRQQLRIVWRDDQGECHLQSLQPLDLRTRQRAEYLLCSTGSGQPLELRLDHIVRAVPLWPEH